MKQLFSKTMALRSRLYEKREWFYLPFVLGTGWAKAFGLGSPDLAFKVVAVVTFALFMVKLVITDYTWREIALIGVTGTLLLYNLTSNGDRTMIATYLAIIGAKGIDLDRVFLYSFWPRVVLTPLRMLLAALGIMENNTGYVGKIYGTVYLHFWGFDNANVLGMSIVGILLLAFLIYRDRMKWYTYLIGLVLLCATFPILQCKSAIAVWVVFCGLSVCRWLSGRLRLERIYLGLCACLPLVICAFSYGGAVWYHYHPECGRILSLLFTGRVQLMEGGLYRGGQLKLLSGVTPAAYFDIAYFHIPYNYGILLFAAWMAAYTIAMWKLAKRGNAYAVLVLATISVYLFMEYPAISTFWNVPLVYLAWALYPEEAAHTTQEPYPVDAEQRGLV